MAIIGWPDDGGRLEELRARGEPRLLLVRDGAPPALADPLEDWIRVPADDRDVAARVEMLRARAAATGPGVVLRGTVLEVGDRSVRLAPIQAALAQLLLERPATVVGRDELLGAGWPDREPPRNALDVQVMRLRKRVAPLGLRIRSVRGHGYLFDPTPEQHRSAAGQVLVS